MLGINETSYVIGIIIGLCIMRFRRASILEGNDVVSDVLCWLLLIALWPLVLMLAIFITPIVIAAMLIAAMVWCLVHDVSEYKPKYESIKEPLVENYSNMWAKLRGLF